jgi:hypothetical protein
MDQLRRIPVRPPFCFALQQCESIFKTVRFQYFWVGIPLAKAWP